MPNNYALNFKDPDGNWKTIPGLYTEIYDAYVAYCQAQTPPVTPVSQTTYYTTLGRLNDLVEALTESPQVAELIEQLQEGVLPTLKGGLGAAVNQTIAPPSGGAYASLSAYLAANTNLYTLINTLSTQMTTLDRQVNTLEGRADTVDSQIATLAAGKLSVTAMNMGTAEPTSATTGTFYFQYEE